jgi:hypothetical protein
MALTSISGPTPDDYLDQLGFPHQTWKECLYEPSVCWNIAEACRSHCFGHIRQSLGYRNPLSRWFWCREEAEEGGCKGPPGEEVFGYLSRRKD